LPPKAEVVSSNLAGSAITFQTLELRRFHSGTFGKRRVDGRAEQHPGGTVPWVTGTGSDAGAPQGPGASMGQRP